MARVSKHWEYNPKYDVDEFNLEDINKDNLINHLLKLKHSDVSYTMMMELFGSFDGKSLCSQYDTFDVPPKAYTIIDKNGKPKSNTTKFRTTIGIWIFNIFLFRDFGLSFLFDGYINENIDKKKFEKINQTLVYALLEDKITQEVYTKFLDCTQFLMPYESILAPNHTEKLLSCTRILNKKKEKLIKENKEELDKGNVVIAEKIEQELIAFAKEYLKDDPSLDVYLSGAGGNFDNNFKNMYIMKGAVRNPDPNAKQEYTIVTSSYIDGITADEYTTIANSLSAGPYARGKKTEVGGYYEKLFGAAFQTIVIDEPGSDCGSKEYIEVLLTENNIQMFMYNYIIKSDGSLEELTNDNKNKYINKKVKMRFVIYCKSKKEGKYCNKCAGNFFYRRGNNRIGLATIQAPTKLKLISMKSFHDSTINTVEIDPMKVFGLTR